MKIWIPATVVGALLAPVWIEKTSLATDRDAPPSKTAATEPTSDRPIPGEFFHSNANDRTGHEPSKVRIDGRIRSIVNVRDFGAVCDDLADDTLAVQKALDGLQTGAREIVFPAMCRVSGELSWKFTGSLSAVSGGGIRATSVSGDVLSVRAPHSSIRGLTFARAKKRLGGADVKVHPSAVRFNMSDTTMNDPHVGIHLVEAVSPRLTNNRVYWYDAAAPSSIGILVEGVVDGTIHGASVNGNSGGYPGACLKIKSSSDLTVGLSNFIGCDTALSAEAPAGSEINSLRVFGSYFDSSNRAIDLFARGGSIQRSDFFQSWAGGSVAGNGVTLRTTASGRIDGVAFHGLHAFLNADAGLSIVDDGVINTSIVGGEFAGNGSVGIHAGRGAGRYKIVGATIGPVAGIGPNLKGGLLLSGGVADDILVTANKVKDNVGHQMSIGFSPSATRIVADNIRGDGGWIRFLPTVATTRGRLAVAHANGRYRARGSSVALEIIAVIDRNGTGDDTVVIELPFAAATRTLLFGREEGFGNEILTGLIEAGSSTLSIVRGRSEYPGGDDRTLALSGIVEVP